jgi:hypothetical protein
MADFRTTFGDITSPPELGGLKGAAGINDVLSRVVELIFIFAAVTFTFMFLWAAVSMIMSGGDKESLAKAQARIRWAIIGIVLLALSFVIFSLLSYITGFKFFI